MFDIKKYHKTAKWKAYQRQFNQSAAGKAWRKQYCKDHPNTTEHMAWENMRRRVKPDFRYHVNYFDRGITCCARWGRFKNFLADMGLKPSPELTLERRDNNKGYSPDNCYWASRSVQNENQRPRKDNTTGCTGVTVAPNGKFIVTVFVEGKNKVLGRFSTFKQAAEVRKEAEVSLYGKLRQTSKFSTTQTAATQLSKAA